MNIKVFLKQYEKDLNDLYNWRKCPNDFTLKYFFLLSIPEFIIATLLFIIIFNLKKVGVL